jgi:hypothetical protein
MSLPKDLLLLIRESGRASDWSRWISEALALAPDGLKRLEDE